MIDDTTANFHAGDLIDHRYRVIAFLGAGGTSRIYRVHDLERDREMALKLLTPPFQPDMYRTLFQREFMTLYRLRHPNIVRVYDYGRLEDGNNFFTMEYLDGQPLSTLGRVADFGPFIEHFIGILRILQFIHAKGLIHGDVKPTNIILMNDGSLKLTDFGMAVHLKSSESLPVLGTISYMPPEIIRRSGPDRRSDLYSLGVMAYEMIGGELPFSANDPVEMMRKHVSQVPVALREMRPDCPDVLSAVVMKCLEKRPLDRYQSADDIIKELSRHFPALIHEETVHQRESYILTAEFVGRKKELEFLIQHFERSLGGNGQAITLGGGSGIGKHRLVKEFKLHCQLEGAAVLHAYCHEGEVRPHQTMVTLCRQVLQVAGRQWATILTNHGDQLRKLTLDPGPPMSHDGDSEGLLEDPTIERTRFYDGLTQLFIDVSKITPLVLIIENMQWTDDVTLGILHYLFRNLSNTFIMVCATYDDDVLTSSHLLGRTEPLETLIEENSENPHFHDVILDPLKPGDVASMIGSMLGMAFKPEEFGKKLYQETGGNPFLVIEIMKQLVQNGVIYREKGEWIIAVDDLSHIAFPSSIREIYVRRLKDLSPHCMSILDALAIPQKDIPFDLLLRFIGIQEHVLVQYLDELIQRDIIMQSEDCFSFTNSRMRELVYEGIESDRKCRLHAVFGELLENSTEHHDHIVSELACHFVRGKNEAKALHYSMRAAEISERVYAHEQAIEHYHRSLSLVDAEADDVSLIILKKLVNLSMMTGNYSEALGYLQRIFDLSRHIPTQNRDEHCALIRKMAGIYQKMGEYDKALKFLYDGLDFLKDEEKSLSLAQLHTNLGNVYMLLGDFDKALTHTQISLDIVDPLGNLRELSEIYNTFGKIYIRKRELELAIKFLTKSLQLRERLGDSLGIGRTYGNLGVISNERGLMDEAEDYYHRGLRIFEKIGFIYGCATIYNNLGIFYHQRKTDWEKAISCLLKAGELHRRTGNEFGIGMTSMNLGLIYRDMGELTKADESFQTSATIYQKLGNKNLEITVKAGRASLFLDQGLVPQARELLEQCKAHAETSPQYETQLPTILMEFGRCARLEGDYATALAITKKALLAARKERDREAEGICRLQEAEINEVLGDSVSQEKHLQESVRILEGEGSMFYLAKSYWALGFFYHQCEQDERALEFIEKARDIFHKIGVRVYYEKAQDLLARMRERVLPNLFKLQADQSEIATLYRVSHDIISILDLPELLEKILDAAVKTVNAERGLLILYDRQTGQFDVKVARNMDRKTQDDLASVSLGVVERTVYQSLPIISTDAMIDPRFKENESVVIFNIKSILCVPLKIKDKVIGALYLDNRALTNQFSERDLDFLVVLANQAAVAIDNAVLYERYRSATENLNVGIIVMDRNGNIIVCNNKAASILDIESENLPEFHQDDTKISGIPAEIGTMLWQIVISNEAVEKEIRCTTVRNKTVIVDISTSFLYDGFGEGIGVIGIFRDITAYRKMQENLELQKRLGAIGDLAAKISHRMKSYLAGIKILAQELNRGVESGESKAEYLAEILLEVAEAEKYVMKELSPGKSMLDGFHEVHVPKLLREVIVANKELADRKKAAIILECERDLPAVPADETQLREVLNNLLLNSLEAIAHNGHVHLRTALSGEFLAITIKDDGCGIPEDIRERIFEPFFTTRDQGSGVGLWVVHNTIRNSGGKISVHSEVGVGTEFQLSLPLNRGSVPSFALPGVGL